MPEPVTDLVSFLTSISNLLEVISRCQAVLFTEEFRKHLTSAVQEVRGQLQGFTNSPYILHPSQHTSMREAGLDGPQLKLKLESYESDLATFESKGGQDNLENVLDKGSIILSSLAGAIPGFGSFAQELVDFILKELRKRFWRPWRS